MNINIKEKEIELHYGFKALMAYENITNKSFNPTTLQDIITFFYSVVLVSDKEMNIKFDDFIEWLDENPSKLEDFSEWFSNIMTKNNKLSPVKEETKPTKSKKK